MANKFPAAWGLTPLETAYLAALRSGKILGPDQLITLHPGVHLPTSDWRANVRRVIGKLRRKLDLVNVEIETRWDQGWILGRAARARLTGLLKAA